MGDQVEGERKRKEWLGEMDEGEKKRQDWMDGGVG